MQTLPLRRSNLVALIDDEDWRLEEYTWCLYMGNRARAWIPELGHRVHLGHAVLGYWDKLSNDLEVDHIDRNPLNNCRNNLRVVNHLTNMRNRREIQDNNTSGVRGVSWHKGKYQARIRVQGELIYLGRHDTIEAASAAYERARHEHGMV